MVSVLSPYLMGPAQSFQGPASPGTIVRGPNGTNYQYAETTGMDGATGSMGWIPTTMSPRRGGSGLRELLSGGSRGGMLSDLLDPSIALPMAGAMMMGQTPQESFGGALQMAGAGLSQRKQERETERAKSRTLELLQEFPDLARWVEGGALTPAQAYEEYKTRKAGKEPKYINAGDGRLFNASTGEWLTAPGGNKPLSTVGKIQADFQAGLIDAATRDALIAKQSAGEGFEITMPDGTMVRQGVFGNQDQKNVANRVTDEQNAAAVAANLKQTVQMLRQANENVGYSGVGGGVYGAIDDTLEQVGAPSLPGNARGRATMRAGGLQVALSNVEKTKGAISNAEMQLFMAASPGLQNTPQGNAALLDMVEAIADRQMQRVEEMEKWRQQYGTLDGFEATWGQYIAENPLIVPDGQGGVALNNSQGGGAPAANDPLGIR